MVSIDVLLDGQRARTTTGVLGFCSVILVEGEHRTLFDVGHVGRRVAMLGALGQRGLGPEDIDTVVLSHAHWDHAQNLDVFSSARILMHGDERRYASAPHRNDWATPGWTGRMLAHEDPRIVDVGDGFQIEPGVTIWHTPGHSVGSISLAVETDRGLAVMSGDVLHYATAALSRKNPIVFWDDAAATASIDRIVAAADVIYPGHDRPFRLTGEDSVEYLSPYDFTIVNVDPDDAGFSIVQAPPANWIMPGIEEQRLQAGDGG